MRWKNGLSTKKVFNSMDCNIWYHQKGILRQENQLSLKNCNIELEVSKLPNHKYFPKYWAERPQPIEGESISSFMIRIALMNLTTFSSMINTLLEVSNYAFLNSLTNKTNYTYCDFDILWIPKLINYFFLYTGISKEALKRMSLYDLSNELNNFFIHNEKDHKSIKQFNILWKTYWYQHNHVGLRYCPLCLKKEKIPFFKNIWRLRFISFCLRHNCFFESKCPKCKAKIVPYQLKWDSDLNFCYKCGWDLSKSKAKFISNKNPLLNIYKNFFNKDEINFQKIFDMFLEVWKILIKPDYVYKILIDDPLFSNVKFIKWKDPRTYRRYSYELKRRVFSDKVATYIIVGTAINNILLR